MSQLKNSISGVRGVAGESLTPEIVHSYARAFGVYCGGGRVVVGRDSRTSGPLMVTAVRDGLAQAGCEIVDLGIVGTPTTKIATEKLGAAGGIVVTASHNPAEWNGLKMVGRDGLFLDEDQTHRVDAIRRGLHEEHSSHPQRVNGISYDDAEDDHLRLIYALPFIDVEQIRRARIKVVADCVNGAGGRIVSKLLTQLGCDAVLLHEEPNGRFPHNPEPVPEHLGELCGTVQTRRADIGIAVDPDVDRLAVVSEAGTPLGEEYTLALATAFVLEKRRGPVVVNLSTSLAIDEIAARHGCAVERTKVGEINVASRMREIRAVIGGEGSGGVILPDVHLGRDAVVAIALVLQSLSEFGETLSRLHATLPQYVMCKRKIFLGESTSPGVLLDSIRHHYRNEVLDTRDGIKIIRENSWVNVRVSNTEPIVRVIAEASTRRIAEQYCEELSSLINRQ